MFTHTHIYIFKLKKKKKKEKNQISIQPHIFTYSNVLNILTFLSQIFLSPFVLKIREENKRNHLIYPKILQKFSKNSVSKRKRKKSIEIVPHFPIASMKTRPRKEFRSVPLRKIDTSLKNERRRVAVVPPSLLSTISRDPSIAPFSFVERASAIEKV